MGDWSLISSDGLPPLIPQTRAPGPHVSDLIRRIARRNGYLAYPEDSTPPRVKWEIGHALEHAVCERLAIAHPDEYYRYWDVALACWRYDLKVTVDGIHATLDLWQLPRHMVEDVKGTWKSSRVDINDPRWWMERTQVAVYCYMIDSDVGRLRPFYFHGDYAKGGGDAVAQIWERRFTRQELIETWAMVLSERDVMMAEAETIADGDA